MKKNGKLQGLLRTIGEYALSVGVFIALWWIYVAVKHVPAYILPSPPKVWSSPCQNVCKRNCIRTSLDDDL